MVFFSQKQSETNLPESLLHVRFSHSCVSIIPLAFLKLSVTSALSYSHFLTSPLTVSFCSSNSFSQLLYLDSYSFDPTRALNFKILHLFTFPSHVFPLPNLNFLFNYYLEDLFLAALDLHCFMWVWGGTLHCGISGRLLLLESAGSRACRFQLLRLGGSVVGELGLSCFKACAIFLGQGMNPCPLNLQIHSYPLCHQRSPVFNDHICTLA